MLILFPRKSNYSKYWIPIAKPRIPTIDELCSGKIVNVRRVLERNKMLRNELYNTTRGYTNNRCNKLVGGLTIEVLKHPELGKYFQAGQDRHERAKNQAIFYKKYPEFKAS